MIGGFFELRRFDEEMSKKRQKPAPPKSGNLILEIYDSHGTAYQGKTGPFMHDKSAVLGWHDHEWNQAMKAARTLRQFVGLEARVGVISK